MPLDFITAKSEMSTIARMAYGSGIFEGTSGGKGHIGMIVDLNGKGRVIKFNTHFSERGKDATIDQIKSSNALRTKILAIAKTLNPEVVADVRKKLGLAEGENPSADKPLLTRKIVASVLKMIDKNAMSDAMKGVDADKLKSYGGTQFNESRIQARYGLTVETLQKCGMSEADFKEAVDSLAEKFTLTGNQKMFVAHMTAKSLTALAEAGESGYELKRRISNGTFTGTYMGLVHINNKEVRKPDFHSDDYLLSADAASVLKRLTTEECLDAAYLLTKMGTQSHPESNVRVEFNVEDNQLTGFALKALVEKRETLMALHRREGNLSVETIWKQVAGMKMPAEGMNYTADFSREVEKKFYNQFVDKNPVAIEKWENPAQFTSLGAKEVLRTARDLGVTLADAAKLTLSLEGASVDDARGLKEAEEAIRVRTGRYTERLKFMGTEEENARAANFTNTIATPVNYRKIRDRISVANPNLPDALEKKLATYLMAMLSEDALDRTVKRLPHEDFEVRMNAVAGTDEEIRALAERLRARA